MTWVVTQFKEHYCSDCRHVKERREWVGEWKPCPSCKGTGGESLMGHNDSTWFPCGAGCSYGKVPDEG